MADYEALKVDLHFDDISADDQLILIVLELVKSLLYQRRQIPQTLDSLRSASMCQSMDHEMECSSLTRKQERERVRRAKLKCKFEKKAAKCVAEFDVFEGAIKDTIGDFDVDQVALILGLSPACPKEIYMINLPFYKPGGQKIHRDSKIDKRKLIRIFRTVVITAFAPACFGI